MDRAHPSIYEWIAAAAGCTLVLLVIGFMVYEAATLSDHPVPRLAVRLDTVIAYPGGYIAEFRATNSGDATAAGVVIEGRIRDDTVLVERSEATINFVPAHSWRGGGLLFKNDPRRHTLEIRAVGFERP